MRKNILNVIFAALLLLFLSGICWSMGNMQYSSEMVGQKAPDFSLTDNQGNKIDTVQFIGKKPVIFFFWTTWCPHCRQQISHLKEEAKNIKNSGIELIFVNVDESSQQVTGFLKNNASMFSSLLDLDAKVADKYKVVGVPTFVMVGQDGLIKFHDNLLPDNYQKILSGK